MKTQNQDDIKHIDPVMNFMRQAVLEKYGEESGQDFVKLETQKIYEDFSNNLLSYFKPMISVEKKLELDKLINDSGSQEKILGFLMDSIKNFELKIIQYLVEFKKIYIAKKQN